MLVDTHAHLFWDSFKNDFESVVEKCITSGVSTIVNVGVDVNLSEIAANMETGNPKMKFYSTIGIHPHEVLRLASLAQDKQLGFELLVQQEVQKLEEIYKQSPQKVIGVGECGLDFLFESNPDWIPTDLSITQIKDSQRQLFKSQIDLAKRLNLPLIIHCRDDRTKNPDNTECWNECLDMVKGCKGILHCYSGTMPITQRTMNHELINFLISFAANITYPKNEYLREAVKILPIEKMVLETDCPFLSPQSKRGQRNDPSAVVEIAQIIAEIKKMPFEKIAEATTKNFKSLFTIP